MSLSFVSKSVLTAKEGGDGYEETPIEGKEDDGGSSSRVTNSQPLFDQLRNNKEQEEAEREEFQKSIMRGTLALDEEDCAHLDAVRKQKQERDHVIQRETQSELEAFRAAQAVNRIEQGTIQDDEEEEEEDVQQKEPAKQPKQQKTATNKPRFPKIVVKKRKKIGTGKGEGSTDRGTADVKKQKQNSTVEAAKPADPKPAMAGLLAGYGSDSDSD